MLRRPRLMAVEQQISADVWVRRRHGVAGAL